MPPSPQGRMLDLVALDVTAATAVKIAATGSNAKRVSSAATIWDARSCAAATRA